MYAAQQAKRGGDEMIRVAIVEDDAAEREKIQGYLNELSRQEQIQFEIAPYPSGLNFIMGEMKGFDIVLMDIDMPGVNGMETAQALRKVDPTVILIFVTNMAQYAISGYEVDATDFILKPVNKYSFAIKIKRAVARTAKKNDEVIQIKQEGTLHLVPLSIIKYLEVTGHYVIYHTAQGDFTEYTTLKEAQKKINRPHFAQCNQSYLVNLKYLEAVSRETVTVSGAKISVSRKMRPAFLNAVTDFLGGKSL